MLYGIYRFSLKSWYVSFSVTFQWDWNNQLALLVLHTTASDSAHRSICETPQLVGEMEKFRAWTCCPGSCEKKEVPVKKRQLYASTWLPPLPRPPPARRNATSPSFPLLPPCAASALRIRGMQSAPSPVHTVATLQPVAGKRRGTQEALLCRRAQHGIWFWSRIWPHSLRGAPGVRQRQAKLASHRGCSSA
jgi:hypothetical protein